MRDDCLYIFGHNFLIICPILKLFFFKFSERLALSVKGVGVHKGTASYTSLRDNASRVNGVSLYLHYILDRLSISSQPIALIEDSKENSYDSTNRPGIYSNMPC